MVLLRILVVAATALASPIVDRAAQDLGPNKVVEKVTPPSQWKSTGAAHPSTTLQLQIGLKQNNIAGLQKKLADVSNPSSANYGKWLSKEEVETYTSPSALSLQIVHTWLAAYGISKSAITQPTPDWITVSVPISKAEMMLDSKYDLFQDAVTGLTVPRATEYSLPQLLHDHVDTIQPTTAFHRNMGPQAGGNTTEGHLDKRATCNPNSVTPACIQSYYNVDYTSKGKASLGVTGFIGYSASHTDARQYLATYDSAASGTDFNEQSISGAENDPSNPTLEGNLDTQLALSLGYPNPVSYYSVAPTSNSGNDFGDALVNFGTYLNSASSPPSSISTSYGGEENGFSSAYLDRICNEFMKAGSRGVSIFFSSGDFGVGGNGESNCNNGFYALFPASCPYITSVGSTQFYNGQEYAATFPRSGSTGGGFSWYFSAPSYQTSDTKSYISNNLDSSFNGYYNAQGRGYPDVALVGEYYPIVMNGAATTGVYGTSASSPAWAALVSLINDYRISEGKSTLGFLNPLLYGNTAARAAFNDIVNGNNQGCGTNGYPAAEGWDPTTGLGTLNFAKLRKALA